MNIVKGAVREHCEGSDSDRDRDALFENIFADDDDDNSGNADLVCERVSNTPKMPPPGDKKFLYNGKEYKRSYYYALKRRERIERSDERKAAQTAVAAHESVFNKVEVILSALNRDGGPIHVMEETSSTVAQHDNVNFMLENVNSPFNNDILSVDNVNLPVHDDTLNIHSFNSPVHDDTFNIHTFNSPFDHAIPSNSEDINAPFDHAIPSNSTNIESVLNMDAADVPNFTSTYVSSLELNTSQQYLPPIQHSNNSRSSAPKSAREIAISKLHTIFTVNKATVRLQDAILQFLQEVPRNVVNELPRSHTTLRPSTIYYDRYSLHPGEMIYFGVANVLTLPGLELFDRTLNTIQLSISIDGLPLCRDANGVGFWPLLAAANQYPVFLVGLYCGKSKPECPNAFMRPFVKELKTLENEGLCVPVNDKSNASENCSVKVYSVRLHNLIMDLPALSYITCIIGHAGANACPKCTNPGRNVSLSGLGLNKKGAVKKGVRYTDVYDAAPRTHEDFRVYFKHSLVLRLNTGRLATDCCSLYSAVREHCEGSDGDRDALFENLFEDDDNNILEPEDQLVNDEQHIKFLRQHHHQKHRAKRNMENADHVTILFLLKHFDIIDHIPIEYMHAVCLGIMQSLLFKWTYTAKFKMNTHSQSQVSNRLLRARQYFPVEFQRKPEKLQYLKNWKATQYRSFLLYVGVVALHGILDVEKLNHFFIFVTAMRTLVCRVDSIGDCQRIMKERAEKADMLLRFFVEEAVRIYGPEIASLKLHLLLHIVEDYLRFGPLDLWSAFRFESILGKIKRLVYAHRNPGSQIINAYSSLLQTGHFGKAGNRGIDSLEEYFEQPTLKYPYHDLLDKCADEELPDEAHVDAVTDQCYKRLYVRAFVIRTDNEADSCCVIKGNIFMKVRKIVQNRNTSRIFLYGNTFDHLESLYSITIPNDEGGNVVYTSDDVGILRGRLTNEEFRCGFEDILQKMCVIPLDEYDSNVPCPSTTEKVMKTYALLRFLH